LGHNVHVDTRHRRIVGVAGSTASASLLIGGGVGVEGHLGIGDDVQITGMSMVTKSLKSRASIPPACLSRSTGFGAETWSVCGRSKSSRGGELEKNCVTER
jgi:UDP-3-O-[3-hydroxymyristoyl] glucosamine N-acyltransferase